MLNKLNCSKELKVYMISINPYEKSIDNFYKPPLIMPELEIQKGNIYIKSIDEIIIENFNKYKVKDNNIKFVLFYNDIKREKTIDISIYRTLSAVFLTIGRFYEEIEAIYIIQVSLIKNISNIANKSDILKFFETLPRSNKVLCKIKNTLAELCQKSIN